MISASHYSLSLDLSGATASMSLHEITPHRPGESILIVEKLFTDGHRRSEKLIPELQKLMADSQIPLSSVGCFVTGAGPGSFTGLRIAFASLKAFSMAFQRPLEALNGNEARAIAWVRENKPQYEGQLIVISHVASGKFVMSAVRSENGKFEIEEETIIDQQFLFDCAPLTVPILVDEKTLFSGAPSLKTAILFPLRSRHLGLSVAFASSRQQFQTIQELIRASPHYFGETRFKEASLARPY